LLREVDELEAFGRRGEEGDDFATEVAAKFALVGGLTAQEVEVDETGEGIGLCEESNQYKLERRLTCAGIGRRENGNAQPTPSTPP
jgi:hypothetical protein